MLIYKFGGGVLCDSDGIRQMGDIIESSLAEKPDQELVIVVSALGKMTNAFERLYSDWYSKNSYTEALIEIYNYHVNLVHQLLDDRLLGESMVKEAFSALEAILEETPIDSEDKAYDKIVVHGELISSEIVSYYLKSIDVGHELLDARDLIKTNSFYQDARIDWGITSERVLDRIKSDKPAKVWLTQGFIGSDENGFNTTLGREGSDFTAALLASILNADEVIIWKDVPGIMTGDPKEFADVQKLSNVSYLEAIELTYFGAKILHPNTIRPLHNSNIPLKVKSIYKPHEDGTLVVRNPDIVQNNTIVILKSNQVLVSIQPRNFSFIMEESVSFVFALLAKHKLRVNLLQHGAVSMSFCLDYHESGLNKLIGDLIPDYKVLYNQGLELLTIRRYNDITIDKHTKDRKVYVKQMSRKTARFVLS